MSIIKRAILTGKMVISNTLLQCPKCGHRDVGKTRKCPLCGTKMIIIQENEKVKS